MFVSPMLLQETNAAFDSEDYIAEVKWDGIRLIYSNMQGYGPKLYTRHNTEISTRFPEIISVPIPEGIILDGELILPDVNGKPDFEGIMSRFQTKKPVQIQRNSISRPATLCVFDVIYYKGESIADLQLLVRKKYLDVILKQNSPRIIKVEHFDGLQSTALLEACKAKQLEGIVMKAKNSPYVFKRSANWLKAVAFTYSDVWITGIRKGKFGLLLSFDDGRSAGILELYVPPQAKEKIYYTVNHLKTGETEKYIYLAKESLRCRVKHRNLTSSGKLRQPTFVSLI